jgi:predicted nucleotidyltransferase
MAKIPDRIREITDRYFALLQSNGILIQRAVLFGSYAHGQARPGSDIDLAIVSDYFEGDRFKDKNKIRRFTISTSIDLEVLPFNPKDFTANDPLVKEILDTGLVIL